MGDRGALCPLAVAEDGQPWDWPEVQMGRAGAEGAQGSSNAPAPAEGPATPGLQCTDWQGGQNLSAGFPS